jgi:hypothetical protein
MRVRRNKPADVETAMQLLRPLFCDEQLTYVTEDGASGLLAAGAVVDDGLHSVYFQIQGTGWPWEWWQDRQLRLSPAGAPDAIDMMPVRGASVISYEKQFLSARALPPEQILRVRALDWHTPALSDFRCGLWTEALPRVIAEPPMIAAETKNSDIFQPLLDDILVLHRGDFGLGADDPAEVAIVAPTAGRFVTLGKADEATISALARAIADGSINTATCGMDGSGFCESATDAFGAMVENRFKSVEATGRSALAGDRDARGCLAKQRYENAPFIPALDCSGGTGTSDGGGETGDGGESSGGSESSGGDAGDCCTAHAAGGCENPDTQMCVCAEDAFCCDTEWDAMCVEKVGTLGCAPGCG